jgi:protein gp37
MKNTTIEWADHTYNPWWGCSEIPGPKGKPSACDHCYAKGVAGRFAHIFAENLLIQISTSTVWGPESDRLVWPQDSDKNREPLAWNRQAERKGERHRVFCLSMGDIMERNDLLIEPRKKVFELVEKTPFLDWMFLTKRPQEYKHFLPEAWLKEPRHNVWLMTTIERADLLWRLDEIMAVPAVVHGVSMEPLFDRITLPSEFLKKKHSAWVITGGESGRQARRHDPAHFRFLRDQCVNAGVPFHFKQWGEFDSTGKKVGKEESGRILDGRTWDDYPVATRV